MYSSNGIDGIANDLMKRKEQLQSRIDARGPLSNVDLANVSQFVQNLTGAPATIRKDPLDNVKQEQRTINSDLMNMSMLKEKLKAQQERDRMKLMSKARRGPANFDETYVPDVGFALTKDDSKKLKAAKNTKAEFDNALSEIVDLRNEYGGEFMNREAVARGKSLAKNLLLKVKDLANLGVLSQSDEKILADIVSNDPLSFDVSGLVGQDPTMERFRTLQEQMDKNYKEGTKSRLKYGIEDYDKMPDSELEYHYKLQGGK